MGNLEGKIMNQEEYQRRLLEQKSQDNPREILIRDKVRAEILVEEWAIDAFAKIKQEQIDYLKEAIQVVNDESKIHELTQRVLGKISQEVKSKIIEGEDLLKTIPKNHPSIITTNHFGAYKLMGIKPKEDIGVNIPGYDNMYPSPMYFASLKPIADKTGNELYYTSTDFPGIFGEIHRKSGFIHIPPFDKNKTEYLTEQTKRSIAKHPNSAIVSFPEGTTSGKPSGRGPYDLEPFKTGSYVIAAELNMYIIPVIQYFNPKKGYELKVLKPFIPEKGDRQKYSSYANQHREEMQNWLDIHKANGSK